LTREATRRNRLRAVEFRPGDFLDVVSVIPPATIVTMDRVICCYPVFESLLEEALAIVLEQFRIWWIGELVNSFGSALGNCQFSNSPIRKLL
jgi:hypothetical protein